MAMRQLKIVKQITNRETQSLDKYLQEIGRVDLITADMEVALAKQIKAGDQIALEKMVKANLRFVVSVAKQYQNNGLSLGDLINEGNLGLIKAAMRFDETRGFKFISYAVWWIRQCIMQALAEQSRVVRIPLNRVGSLNKLNRTFAQLEQKFQREPSADELAEVLQIHPDEITDTIKMGSRQVSVHAPFVHGEENGLLDVLEDESQATPDSALIDDSLQKDIKRSLSKLSDKEADVISRYFGLNGETTMTLDEIGEVLEITRERVRQIKEKGIQKLRNSNKSKALKSYLG
jgi:RNA polymerase primary sigma factor